LSSSDERKGALGRSVEEVVRSNWLPRLVAFIRAYPSFAPLLPNLVELRLVIDANRVRAELHWRLKTRRKPDSRSALHESLDAGLVVFFAPEHIKAEIEEHYEDIARQTGTTIFEVKREWARFQKYLRFYAPKTCPSATETYADVDDFPYLATWKELDARAVYTTDAHLATMGAPVVSVLIDTHLRAYARASTVKIVVGIGSTISFVVGVKFVAVVFNLLDRCIQAIRRLPPAAQVGLVAAGLVCIAHPRSRAKLREKWSSLRHSEALLAVGDAIADFALQVAGSAEKAKKSLQSIQAALPAQQKQPLVLHARAVCTAASSPLTLAEIERRIRRGGYVTGSRTFRRYLRSVMRTDRSFVEVRPGKWALRPAKQPGNK
jgi:hypothetical protein